MALFTAETAKLAADASHTFESARYRDPIVLARRSEVFRLKSIYRARKQIETLFEAMLIEIDPAKIDKYASALSRLNEIERVLEGRPMPGSLKPRQPRAIENSAEPVPEWQPAIAGMSGGGAVQVPAEPLEPPALPVDPASPASI